MKPFKLSEFVSNEATPVKTRDGRKVRIVCTNMSCKYPIVAAVQVCNSDKENPNSYDENGHSFRGLLDDALYFVTPKVREGWLNIYPAYNLIEAIPGETIYTSEEDARAACSFNPKVATIKINW